MNKTYAALPGGGAARRQAFIRCSLLIAACILPASLQAVAGYKTMHFENDLPRPAGVQIAGAGPDQVVMYCTTVSQGCATMREHLKQIGLDYLDKNPDTDPVAAAEFAALGGQGVPLVVFKHRLMHGYFPASFDRLYAQYHTGTQAVPTEARSDGAAAGKGSATATPAGKRPDEIPASGLEAYLQDHPLAVVQFTSPDKNCGFCVDGSFEAFDAAAAAYSGKAAFARVSWTPWQKFPVEATSNGIGGIPTQLVFRNGKLDGRYMGTIGASQNQYKFRRWLEQQLGGTK